MKTALKATFVFAVLALARPALAQDRLTEHTRKLNPGKSSPPIAIAEMSWLEGHWTGPALGGLSEEIWSPARNSGMMGMYRLIKDGKPIFYEFFTLAEENGSLIIRLKHFNPNMEGWEEKDKTVDFPFVAKDSGIYHFDGMAFKPEGKNAITIYLAIHNKKDGNVREETFRYTRVKSNAGP
jgi:hypothetical protein